MSAQPLSRADRKRVIPRCFAGIPVHRLALRPYEKMVTVCTGVDVVTGTVTVESMTEAEHRRRLNPKLTVTPDDMRASFADGADTYHFTQGLTYERLADGTWRVTEPSP